MILDGHLWHGTSWQAGMGTVDHRSARHRTAGEVRRLNTRGATQRVAGQAGVIVERRPIAGQAFHGMATQGAQGGIGEASCGRHRPGGPSISAGHL